MLNVCKSRFVFLILDLVVLYPIYKIMISRSFSIFNYYVIYRPGYCPVFVLDGHDMN